MVSESPGDMRIARGGEQLSGMQQCQSDGVSVAGYSLGGQLGQPPVKGEGDRQAAERE